MTKSNSYEETGSLGWAAGFAICPKYLAKSLDFL